MQKSWVSGALALFVLLGAAGCGSKDPVTRSPHRSWTFMVYLDGDSDLEQDGILNINQMESIGSTDSVSIVVQFDRGPSTGGAGDWTGARRFLIQLDRDRQTITSPVLQDLGPTDMGRPETLRQFITWATTTFPADHSALVLWNHGAGWRSRAQEGGRGILFDDTSGSFMTMGELRDAMASSNVRFDLTAIDCSLMAMLEVFYEIRGQTDYIVASEESPPAAGYPYDAILSQLAAKPEMTPEELGRAIVNAHVDGYPNTPVTQSLVQTSRLPELARRVDAFAAALLKALPDHKDQFTQARTASQAYAFAYYRDLYDFARNARATFTVPEVQQAADAVMAGIPGETGGPVLAERHNLAGVMNSHGLSIYLPGPDQIYGGYDYLRFPIEYPNWSRLIRASIGSLIIVPATGG